MIVYRIVHKVVKDLLTGSGNDGRWCSGGRKVIYTASSISLACLENLLRRGGSGFSSDFRTIFYEIPDKKIEEVLIESLDFNWRLYSNYPDCQKIGNSWYDSKDAVVLKVPSAVIPDEFNYVIKNAEQNVGLVKVIEQRPFVPDARLDNLLTSVDVNKLKNKK